MSKIKAEKKNNTKTKVKEFFTSIQGEGSFVGYNQLFIRFCKCNLSCHYCDTDFDSSGKQYTPEELKDAISELDLKNIHSISLTGGEPLLDTDFLKEFLPLVNNKIYLETNGTLAEKLVEVIKLIDIISMDIKLASSTGLDNLFEQHKKFIEICIENKKDFFIKIVITDNITDAEIEKSIKLAQLANCELVLQPVMVGNTLGIKKEKMLAIFNNFTNKYKKTRLIPQVHKFIEVE